MNLMGLFRSPQNELEKGGIKPGSEETGINNTCPHCGALLPISEQWENLNVCTSCGYHFRIGPRERVAYLADEGTFEELDAELLQCAVSKARVTSNCVTVTLKNGQTIERRDQL